MNKKKIKIVLTVVLSILIIGAVTASGYLYWKKYGRKTEGVEGDYSKSRIVYLKDDRIKILDENYNVGAEARFINKYTKFKSVNDKFIILTNEDGNIAVADISKQGKIKVTDEQKKLDKSGHRHIFVFENGYFGILSDNGIYSEEKDVSLAIAGKEIVKSVKDSIITFYKLEENGKITDAVFEDIKPVVKTGRHLSIEAKDYILYFNKENRKKPENILEKKNVKDGRLCEVKENKIIIYDVSGGKYPKKIFETDVDKDSKCVAENKDIVQITKGSEESIFKQFEYNVSQKYLSIKSEVRGAVYGEVEVIRLIDNKLFFKNIDGMGVNTELNFVDFEDNEAGIQNISSISYGDIKYIEKRGESKYLFSEGNAIFEIDLSKRKVENGSSSYEKKYMTKYVTGFVKSNKNEIYTVYSDNKNLYVEKNDFNKISDFLEIAGIVINSTDLYLKQIVDIKSGEKIALWENTLSEVEAETEYKSIIGKMKFNSKKINIGDIKGIEYSSTGEEPAGNVIYDGEKIYYAAKEINSVEDVSENSEFAPAEESSTDEYSEENGESESQNTESTTEEATDSEIKYYLYITDENMGIAEKYEIPTNRQIGTLLKDGNKIYLAGKGGLFIFNISSKEMKKGEIGLGDEESSYKLLKTKNKLFIIENKKEWEVNNWSSVAKIYEIEKESGAKLNEYSADGKEFGTAVSYENKIIIANGKNIEIYSEEMKPIDKVMLKEKIEFMEISGCRVYAAGTYINLAEVNIETGEVMSEKYIPNLADADYIRLIYLQ